MTTARTKTATVVEDHEPPQTEAVPDLAQELRQRIEAFNQNTLERTELSADDRTEIDSIVELAERLRREFEGTTQALFSQGGDRSINRVSAVANLAGQLPIQLQKLGELLSAKKWEDVAGVRIEVELLSDLSYRRAMRIKCQEAIAAVETFIAARAKCLAEINRRLDHFAVLVQQFLSVPQTAGVVNLGRRRNRIPREW